jgi:hypothetical protein
VARRRLAALRPVVCGEPMLSPAVTQVALLGHDAVLGDGQEFPPEGPR